MAINLDFRERVLREMREQGLNQTVLSLRSGIQRANLTNILSGRNKPSYENFIKIADALHVTLDKLAGR